MIYFTQEDITKNVKVGYTRNVLTFKTRLKSFRDNQSQKVNVLKLSIGSRADEAFLHTILNKHNIKGEFYHPHPDVFNVMRAWKGKGIDYKKEWDLLDKSIEFTKKYPDEDGYYLLKIQDIIKTLSIADIPFLVSETGLNKEYYLRIFSNYRLDPHISVLRNLSYYAKEKAKKEKKEHKKNG